MNDEFRVGDWAIRPQTDEIQHGGEIRQLEPKVMDVLCHLARHGGEVLTKERLIQAVWPEMDQTVVWVDRKGGEEPLDLKPKDWLSVRIKPDGRGALLTTVYPPSAVWL